jgi:hypothetical protein
MRIWCIKIVNVLVICFSGWRFHDVWIQVAEGNDWKTCGFYKGPREHFQIIFIVCDDAVRGDTLMLTIQSNPHENDALQICEVEFFGRI